ncbi:Leucine rich repeat containing protein BspA family protein [Entamoeba marina]
MICQHTLHTSKNTLDSYSLLIVSKYFESKEDFMNVICVNSKFKQTTEKLRYNPISIISLKLFPKIQTQYLYDENDMKIKGITNYEIWYKIDYEKIFKFKQTN